MKIQRLGDGCQVQRSAPYLSTRLGPRASAEVRVTAAVSTGVNKDKESTAVPRSQLWHTVQIP